MKRVKQLILLFVCILLLSGCVKERITMTIGSDRSMNLEMEVLVSDSLMEGEDTNSEMTEQASELEKKGYTVAIKKDNGYSGYTISKKYKSIDDLAHNNGEAVSLDELTESDENLSKAFKVERGFLKDTYTANFTFKFDQSGFSDTEEENENELLLNTDQIVPTTEAVEQDDTETTGEFDDLLDGMDSYAGLIGQMEFKYAINLPYAAISNNATNVSNDGKSLTWNLASSGTSEINFSFPIYNLNNILIIIGGFIVLVIIIIVILSILLRKRKETKETLIHTDYDSSIVGQIDETASTKEEIPQGPTNHEVSEPDVNVTEEKVEETPTMMGEVNNIPPMPQETVVQTPNITSGPTVEPTINQGVELDIPNMTPLSEENNTINQ